MVRSSSSSPSLPPSSGSQAPSRSQIPAELRKQRSVNWKGGRQSKVLKVPTPVGLNDSAPEGVPVFRPPVRELIYKDLIPQANLPNDASTTITPSSAPNVPSSAASASNVPSSAPNVPSSAASANPSTFNYSFNRSYVNSLDTTRMNRSTASTMRPSSSSSMNPYCPSFMRPSSSSSTGPPGAFSTRPFIDPTMTPSSAPSTNPSSPFEIPSGFRANNDFFELSTPYSSSSMNPSANHTNNQRLYPSISASNSPPENDHRVIPNHRNRNHSVTPLMSPPIYPTPPQAESPPENETSSQESQSAEAEKGESSSLSLSSSSSHSSESHPSEAWVERMRQFQMDQMSRRIGRPKLDRSQTSCFCCRARKTSQWRYLESFLDLSLEAGNKDTSLQLFRLCVCNACWLRVTKMWKKQKTCSCKPRESCSHLQLAVPKILKEVLSNTKFFAWADSYCDSDQSDQTSIDEKFALEVAMSSLTPINKTPSGKGSGASKSHAKVDLSSPQEKNNSARLCDSLPLKITPERIASPPSSAPSTSEPAANPFGSALISEPVAASPPAHPPCETPCSPPGSGPSEPVATSPPAQPPCETPCSPPGSGPAEPVATLSQGSRLRIAPGTLALDPLPFLVLRSLQEKHQLPLDEESDVLLRALYPENNLEGIHLEHEPIYPTLHHPRRVGCLFDGPAHLSSGQPPRSCVVPPPSCVEFARALSRGERFENRIEESYISSTGERVLVVSFSWRGVASESPPCVASD